jgi:hypothetical protein
MSCLVVVVLFSNLLGNRVLHDGALERSRMTQVTKILD